MKTTFIFLITLIMIQFIPDTYAAAIQNVRPTNIFKREEITLTTTKTVTVCPATPTSSPDQLNMNDVALLMTDLSDKMNQIMKPEGPLDSSKMKDITNLIISFNSNSQIKF